MPCHLTHCCCNIGITLIDPANVYVSGVASHLGFVSLPHFLGSSLYIFSIAFAVSGCFSITCFVITWTHEFCPQKCKSIDKLAPRSHAPSKSFQR